MGEFAFEFSRHDFDSNEGVINFGISYELNDKIELNASVGIGLFASDKDSRKFLISFWE